MILEERTVLVTGGTGSFGKTFVRTVLEKHRPRAIRVLSRDELKQSEMQAEIRDPRVRYLLGDVRDADRLRVAMRGVDVVVHAAALKQIPALEYNPFEAVKTNVLGTENVIASAIEAGVSLVVALSTDKAVNPANLYGATKLCAERLIAQAGVYSDYTRFCAVRYGNVVGSRGSVIPVFKEQAATGTITITDERMTRFWMTLDQAVELVLTSMALARDGEVFVPKIPSARVVEIAEAIAPNAERRIVGIRPGEKLHECLLTEDESRHARDLGDRFAILPHRHDPGPPFGEPLPSGFRYSSDSNDRWLDADDLKGLLRPVESVVS